MRIFCLLLSVALTALASSVSAAQTVGPTVTWSWTAVTTGTLNGATVPISGVTYNLYEVTQPAAGACTAAGMGTPVQTGLTATAAVTTAPTSSYGTTQCFAVSASAGGVTGPLSNIFAAQVPLPTPSAPGNVTVTIGP